MSKTDERSAYMKSLYQLRDENRDRFNELYKQNLVEMGKWVGELPGQTELDLDALILDDTEEPPPAETQQDWFYGVLWPPTPDHTGVPPIYRERGTHEAESGS